MALATIAVLDALALATSKVSGTNLSTPLYAIIASDTQIPLTIPSSWGEFSLQYDAQTSDYPQQSGAFQLYNKVRRPQVVYVTLNKTGSDAARYTWLAAIQQQEASNPTQLYTLISPEGVYVDYTLTGLRYDKRPDRGSNALYLELQFTEVPAVDTDTGLFDNVLDAKSGPVAALGRLFTSVASTAQTARANASSFFLG